MNESPSIECKSAGLKSLQELSVASGVSVQTLTAWHKRKPVLFRLLIVGALADKLLDSIESLNG